MLITVSEGCWVMIESVHIWILLYLFLRFEATVQLQIEAAGKILGWSVAFGPKSVEDSSELNNFFELTTPNV